MANCRICNSRAKFVFNHLVMNEVAADYYYCSNCGYLFVDKPHWLHLAYSDAIASTDTGLVARNINISKKLTLILYWLFGERGKGCYVDIAGGYGMLTRLMRDHGIRFYWVDKYCQNNLSIGFEYSEDVIDKIVAITAMEVLEHLEDPADFILASLTQYNTDTLFFTTELYSDKVPDPASWWYYSFETGQHIGFFQQRTLQFIAQKIGMNFHTHKGIHILTKKNLSMFSLKLALSRISLSSFGIVRRKLSSLTMIDHLNMVNRTKQDHA